MAERARTKTKPEGKSKTPMKGDKNKGRHASRGKVAKAKGARGDNSGDHSVPDEVYQRHLRTIERTASALDKAQEALNQARGEHRSAYKLAKDDGCDIEAIKLARKLDQTDHGIVVVTYSNTGRVLALMRSPLAEQLDLFQAMAPVVEKAKEQELDQALAGAHAFSNAEPPSNNPHIAGTMKYGQWEAGYLRAQNEAGGGAEH